MTEVDPGAVALAELIDSVDGSRDRYLKSHRNAFNVGRLVEARIMAAQGASLGVLPGELVDMWLSESDSRVEAQENLSGLPFLATSKDLIEARHEKEQSPERLLEYERSLSIRQAMDSDRVLGTFVSLMIFGDDDSWDDAIRTANDDLPSMAEMANPILDGAYRLSWLCANIITTLDGSQTFAPTWPDLRDGALIDGSQPVYPGEYQDFLAGAGPFPDWARGAVLLAEGRASADDFARYRAALKRASLRLMARWAAAPQSGQWWDRIGEYEEIGNVLLDNLADPKSSVRITSEYGLPWLSLMWRIAPSERRSALRYGQALEVVHRFLSFHRVRYTDLPPTSDQRNLFGHWF